MMCFIIILSLVVTSIATPTTYWSSVYNKGWIANMSPVTLNFITIPATNATSPYHNFTIIGTAVTVQYSLEMQPAFVVYSYNKTLPKRCISNNVTSLNIIFDSADSPFSANYTSAEYRYTIGLKIMQQSTGTLISHTLVLK
jgi:hypothetical protein